MQDFMQQDLHLGDTVIYMPPHSRKYSFGQIVHLTLKTCQIKDIETGDLSTQRHQQVIKTLPDQKISATDVITAIDTTTYRTLLDSFCILTEIFNRNLITPAIMKDIFSKISLNIPEKWLKSDTERS